MTKVLIFETDHALAVQLRSGLTALGCVVQVFKEGATGLMAAVASPPDLILLSVELPRMNGFSVCNKIKKDPALRDVPLVILSEQSTAETFAQHRKLRTCAQDYVHKPIGFQELLQRMRLLVPAIDSAVLRAEESSPRSSRESLSSETADAYGPNGPISARRTMPRQKRPSSTHYPLADNPAPTAPASRPEVPKAVADNAVAADVLVGELAEQAPLPQLSLEERRQHVTLARKTQPRLSVPTPPVEADGREAIGGGHELFQLRELLRRKEKEAVALREQLHTRERELLDLRDEHLAKARSTTGLDDQVVVLERRISELQRQTNAMVAERELDKKRLQDVRAGAKRVAQQLNNRAIELRDAKQAHSQQIGQLEKMHAASMQELEASYRSNMNQNESASQKASDALQLQLTSMQGKLQAAQDAISLRDKTIAAEQARAQKFENELQNVSEALLGASSGANERQAELDILRDDMNVLLEERDQEARRRLAAEERSQRLEEQLDRVRAQAAGLADDCAQAGRDAEQARLDRNAMMTERDAIVAERNAIAADLQAARREYQVVVAEAAGLREQTTSARSSYNELVAERDAALAECDAGIEERSALENRLRLLVSERDALALAVEKQHEEVSGSEARIVQLQAELDEAVRSRAGWDAERQAMSEKHASALKKAQHQYQGELLQRLTEASEEADKQVEALRHKIQANQREHDELVRSNEELTSQLVSVKRQRQSALQKLERSERQWRKDRQALRTAGEALAQIANRVDSAATPDDDV